MSNKIKKMQSPKQPQFKEGFTAKLRLKGGIEISNEYGGNVIIEIPNESNDIAFETVKKTLASHIRAQKIHFNEKVSILMLIEALLVVHRFEITKNTPSQ